MAFQAVLALALSPFVGNGRALISDRPVDVWNPDTGGTWHVTLRCELVFLPWTPTQQICGIPPDLAQLGWIKLGERNELLYGGRLPEGGAGGGLLAVDAPAWSVLSWPMDDEDVKRTQEFRVAEQAVGFPLPSMLGRCWYARKATAEPAGRFEWEPARYALGLRIHRLATLPDGLRIPLHDDPILPLRPLLLGTAGNTGFFALLFVAVWSVSRALWRLLTGAKKRERARRGECVRCAYPLGDLATCPECGKARRRGASARAVSHVHRQLRAVRGW